MRNPPCPPLVLLLPCQTTFLPKVPLLPSPPHPPSPSHPHSPRLPPSPPDQVNLSLSPPAQKTKIFPQIPHLLNLPLALPQVLPLASLLLSNPMVLPQSPLAAFLLYQAGQVLPLLLSLPELFLLFQQETFPLFLLESKSLPSLGPAPKKQVV